MKKIYQGKTAAILGACLKWGSFDEKSCEWSRPDIQIRSETKLFLKMSEITPIFRRVILSEINYCLKQLE